MKETKPKKRIIFKKFKKIALLNEYDKDSNAHIIIRIKGLRGWDGYEIEIYDCDNKIRLHGGLKSQISRKNALSKIDILLNNLILLRNHICLECKRNNIKIYNKTEKGIESPINPLYEL